jgi:xanthine dehydrogenase accessory factor
MVVGAEKGILVRILKRGTANIKLWIGSEDDLENLNLEAHVLEDIKEFWHSKAELQTRTWRNADDPTAKNEDALVVIAERLVERRSLLIFGAGHVGYSIARLGVIIGLDVILTDDRRDFLEKAKSSDPGIQTILVDFTNIADRIRMRSIPAVVIVTRGHQCDEVILRQIANYDVGYIGMIGSRRRVEGIFRRLRDQGVSDSLLRRVKAPIGLDIGAKTPQEIAVSVHAEIIKHFNSADS